MATSSFASLFPSDSENELDKKFMFSISQKRSISEAVQKILRDTNHPELPGGEITFKLHVDGAEAWSWADIVNNGAVTKPTINPHNEVQDPETGRKN